MKGIFKKVYNELRQLVSEEKYEQANRGLCYMVIEVCKKEGISPREYINYLYKNKPTINRFKSLSLLMFT